MKRGDGGYVWVKDNISIKRMSDGSYRLYCIYTDMSKAMEEKAQLRSQYEDLILQHYRTLGRDTLMAGHCNVTQNRIIEIRNYTNSGLFGALEAGMNAHVANPIDFTVLYQVLTRVLEGI